MEEKENRFTPWNNRLLSMSVLCFLRWRRRKTGLPPEIIVCSQCRSMFSKVEEKENRFPPWNNRQLSMSVLCFLRWRKRISRHTCWNSFGVWRRTTRLDSPLGFNINVNKIFQVIYISRYIYSGRYFPLEGGKLLKNFKHKIRLEGVVVERRKGIKGNYHWSFS